jgi:hypothetical protein
MISFPKEQKRAVLNANNSFFDFEGYLLEYDALALGAGGEGFARG